MQFAFSFFHYTVLHLAAENNCIETIKILLQHPELKVNELTISFLNYIWNFNLDLLVTFFFNILNRIFIMLLFHKISKLSVSYLTALQLAIEHDFPDIVALLAQRKDINYNLRTISIHALMLFLSNSYIKFRFFSLIQFQ